GGDSPMGMRTIGMTGAGAGMGAWSRRMTAWAMQRAWALGSAAAAEIGCMRVGMQQNMGMMGGVGRTKLLTIFIAYHHSVLVCHFNFFFGIAKRLTFIDIAIRPCSTSSESLLELIVTTHMTLHV
ncbi:hypothetical protein EDB83DRAFT_2409951, partial [Lactarius deliciosus]